MQIFRNPVVLLVLILLAFLLFGANKLPKMARSLGQSMKILKSEVKEMKADGKNPTENETGQNTNTEAVEGTVISDSKESADQGSKEQSSK